MRNWMKVIAVMGAMVVTPAAVQAQGGAAVTGAWEAQLGGWVSARGGDVHIPGPNTARLEVQAVGDSLVGTWRSEGPPPLELRGTMRGDTLLLAGSRTARINENGQESDVTLRIELEVRPEAGGLTGSMRLREPSGEVVTRAVTLTRGG